MYTSADKTSTADKTCSAHRGSTATAVDADDDVRYASLARDLDALRAAVEPLRGLADLRQLRWMAAACHVATVAGLALAVWGVHPLAPLLLALAASTRWMVLGHHVCHGALDRIAATPAHWRSHSYARGWRRWLQWPDWIAPDAWHREHNLLHHAYTNDAADPDVPQRQAAWIRASRLPTALKYLAVLGIAVTWRWLYYAPNTAACHAAATQGMRLRSPALVDRAHAERLWSPWTAAGRSLWLHSWLPYVALTFGLLPALLLPWGVDAWAAALTHLAAAEVLCSLHTFVVIVPNHAGDDLALFEGRARSKGEWYARQIRGSCNYRTGGLVNDWLHGFLNYQIEHHLWPDLTPRQYAAVAPAVREVCRRHGLAYVQEPVWRRLGRLLDVLVGRTTQQIGAPWAAGVAAALAALVVLPGCGDTIYQTVVQGDCPPGHAVASDAAGAQADAAAAVAPTDAQVDSDVATPDASEVAVTDSATPAGSDSDGGGAADGDGLADVPPPSTGGWPARVFAPYVDATLYPFVKLTDVYKATGQRWFTLAFVVAKSASTCEASWGSYYSLQDGPDAWIGGKQQFLYDDLAQLRKEAGGKITISLGGAAGTPLEVACTDSAQLTAQLAQIVEVLQVDRLDFDVEGAWLTQTQPGQSGERRAQAIAALQKAQTAAGKPLQVWLTLPVLPSGLTADGIATVKQTLAAGVVLSGVNVMTMDYGDAAAPQPQGKMGQYAIDAVTALHGQLGSIYQQLGQPKTDAALWAMTGATPMIGLNDVKSEQFHLADAQQLVAFAAQQQMGLLAMWSVNRDHPCPQASEVQLTCSSVADQTQDWQFTQALATYGSP